MTDTKLVVCANKTKKVGFMVPLCIFEMFIMYSPHGFGMLLCGGTWCL